eukprot:2420662-Prymnesium_polylepis.1
MRHHGRVSTPRVARSSNVSLLLRPSLINSRKSFNTDESVSTERSRTEATLMLELWSAEPKPLE